MALEAKCVYIQDITYLALQERVGIWRSFRIDRVVVAVGVGRQSEATEISACRVCTDGFKPFQCGQDLFSKVFAAG